MSWLVTGGAGYIGAHVVRALRRAGRDVVVVDDLSTGRADRLPPDVPLVRSDVADLATVRETVVAHSVHGVVHLAGRVSSAESVDAPLRYYRDNVEATRRLFEVVAGSSIRGIVLASSAAVYGEQDAGLVPETAAVRPLTPYGRSKLVSEWMLDDLAASRAGLTGVVLRLFNVAGTTPSLGAVPVGGRLVPAVLDALRSGRPPRVFGGDYDTPDGSCVRDYVHVADVAAAFAAAVSALDDGLREPLTMNVGRSVPVSVFEMVAMAQEIAGVPIAPTVRPRRTGDPAAVVADTTRLTERLEWSPRRDVQDMIASEWRARVSSDTPRSPARLEA